MNIGVCRIRLRLPRNSSLKGKRQVLKSIASQLKNRFNVSVAEVDDNDLWQAATLGVCLVSNDRRFTDEVLGKVAGFVGNGRFDVELLDCQTEIINF
ncbi:MAG: DUF503 domain-containing protein [Dehalococcoidales bacterium]